MSGRDTSGYFFSGSATAGAGGAGGGAAAGFAAAAIFLATRSSFFLRLVSDLVFLRSEWTYGLAWTFLAPCVSSLMRLEIMSVSLATRATFCSWLSGERSVSLRWVRLRSLCSLRTLRSLFEVFPAAFSLASWAFKPSIFFLSASLGSAIEG